MAAAAVSSPGSSSLRGRAFRIMLGVLSVTALSANAWATPYNPGRLDAARYAQVADICVTTLGLRASEPPGPAWGAAVNPGLTSGENHYEGCIATLSTALRGVARANAGLRANQRCLDRGLKPDTPDLAECVLNAEDGVKRARTAVNNPAAPTARPFPGSFFSASHREILRREKLACARLGLDPDSQAFDSCVKRMIDTFFSIENPQS